MAKITVMCGQCKKDFVLTVDTGRYGRWRLGEGLVQNMLPELSKGERELLLSGTCGTCFEALFPKEEDDPAGGDDD